MEKKIRMKKIHIRRKRLSEVLKSKTLFSIPSLKAFNKKADQGKVPIRTTGTYIKNM
jgi:hypothetical protein